MTATSLRDRIAQALDEDHIAARLTLGHVEQAEHRRIADLVMRELADADPTDLGMKASGVWYCRRHAGIVNEDEDRDLCPWWDHADTCEAEHDEGLDDGACSPCEWVELLVPDRPCTEETLR